MRLLIVLSLTLVAMAGCFGGGADLSEAEAEARVDAAAADFTRAITEAEAGDIRLIHGEFDIKDTGDDFGFGSGSATMDIEWGQGDAMAISMEMDMGGFSLKFRAYCTPDKTVIVWGNQAYESRPAKDDECQESFGAEDMDLSEAGIGGLDADDAQITIHGDGSITAVIQNETGTFTMHLDKDGRIDRIEMETDEMDGFFEISYGARKALDIPGDTQRIPASLGGYGFFSSFDGEYEWSGGWGAEAYDYDEFEVRVQRDGQTVATFTPGSDAQRSGFTFDFEDDGDGMFGANDTFTISHPDWQQSGDYDVVVWDLWADRDVADNPIPGPLGLLALLGAVLLRRRR